MNIIAYMAIVAIVFGILFARIVSRREMKTRPYGRVLMNQALKYLSSFALS